MLRVNAALVCLLSVLAWPAYAQDVNVPLIVMTGEAVVHRAPDVAYLTAAVESRSKSSRDAQRLNAESAAALRKRLTDIGIPAAALRTLGVSLDQEFENADGRPIPRGWVARNSIEVRLDEVARAGEVLDAVVQAGATSLGGIRFDLKDRSAAEQEAIRLAVGDARARAEAAAAGAGRTIDRILRIEDRRSDSEIPRPLTMMRTASAAVTPVDPGVIDVRAQIALTASMK
jgi:uncharacterized protein YggE